MSMRKSGSMEMGPPGERASRRSAPLKRKQPSADDEASCSQGGASSSRASGSRSMKGSDGGSDTFSETTKRRIPFDIADEPNCLHCRGERSLFCHVIAVADRSYEKYRKYGFLHHRRSDCTNGVLLCSSCHTAFDDPYDPGLVFFPEDLQWFLDYEERERAGRRQHRTLGVPLRKRKPSADEYVEHNGGKYNVYTMTTFMGPEAPRKPGVDVPVKVWKGAPMASLRRAFMVLGNPLCAQHLPRDTVALLRRLQDIYFEREEEEEQSEECLRLGYGTGRESTRVDDELRDGDATGGASKLGGTDEAPAGPGAVDAREIDHGGYGQQHHKDSNRVGRPPMTDGDRFAEIAAGDPPTPPVTEIGNSPPAEARNSAKRKRSMSQTSGHGAKRLRPRSPPAANSQTGGEFHWGAASTSAEKVAVYVAAIARSRELCEEAAAKGLSSSFWDPIESSVTGHDCHAD
ncbi:hypothetical protein LTR35_017607 [Friedmanniomyces endolithicus]|nr:hypothetical protein LTR35_017607 [Friedmanniomyces endolithicus]KAK0268590.1 hypothetical protein LTS00_017535 [Friedmanniomyces endolithicus]